MNVHKRQKKPAAFLKVFERRDEKEDISLLHSSSASLFSTTAANEELDLPPLYHNTLATTKEVENEVEADEIEETFVLSNYDDDDDDDSSSNNHLNGACHAAEGEKQSDIFSDNALASDSMLHLAIRKQDDESAASILQNLRSFDDPGNALQDTRMDSRLFSENSGSLTMNDDENDIGCSPLDQHGSGSGIVVDNSMQVPDNLVRHASASAAAAAAANKPAPGKRASRLLSGAKGLLRVGISSKGSMSPKAPKVELEAAVRKISAGESAKSFAQFSLEEIAPGGNRTPPSGAGLLMNGDELDNNDSDDDSDDQSKRPTLEATASEADQRPSALVESSEQPLAPLSRPSPEECSSDEEECVDMDRSMEYILEEEDSPGKRPERQTKALSEDVDKNAERRARRRNSTSRSMRRPSIKDSASKELSANPRRDRQRSVRSTETASSRESNESHRRRGTLHRSKEGHTEKTDEIPDVKAEASLMKSNKSDRKRNEIKPRRDRGGQVVTVKGSETSLGQSSKNDDNDQPRSVLMQAASAASVGGLDTADQDVTYVEEHTPVPLNVPVATSLLPTDSDRTHENDAANFFGEADGPATPHQPQENRLSEMIGKDRASKSTDSPGKRRSFAKGYSERFHSAAMSPGGETISTTAAVHHRRVATNDDLRLNGIASLNLCKERKPKEVTCADVGGDAKSKKASNDPLRDRSGRSSRQKSRLEHSSGAKSPKKSSSGRNPSHRSPEQKNGAEATCVYTDVEPETTTAPGGSFGKLLHDTSRNSHGNAPALDNDATSNLSPVSPMSLANVNERPNPLPSLSQESTSNNPLVIEPVSVMPAPPEAPSEQPIKLAARRPRQRSALSTHPRSPGKKNALAHSPVASSKDLLPISPSVSPRKSESYAKRGNRSIAVLLDDNDSNMEHLSPSPGKETMNKCKEYNQRQLRSPAPRSHQDVVFTWKRNMPARAANVTSRRTVRMSVVRQGSSRGMEESAPISSALAKAFTAGQDAQTSAIGEGEQTKAVSNALSEELCEEYHRLSAEWSESKARLAESKATTLRLQQDITSLEERLVIVEQGKRS
ncbi:hypothetical protein MPSEU_000728200 [Mayamaea pseudoterrestris]|nr:hypothetical protein MPSEU_000727700 [Mayamaea pseudoterrestris]GKY97700.1 hypothetical protein MPSEU_000728200 [Mayamaea pseudoterrestris]